MCIRDASRVHGPIKPLMLNDLFMAVEVADILVIFLRLCDRFVPNRVYELSV